MAFYQFITTQQLNADIDEVWDFITSPKNLKKITPPHMGFNISSNNADEKAYSGMMISYIVSPIKGLRMKWLTEISHIREGEYFIDEQRSGPYKLWHHQHKIEKQGSKVLMTDIVTYIPPFGFLGRIANTIFIKSKLKQIFLYREKVLNEMFS